MLTRTTQTLTSGKLVMYCESYPSKFRVYVPGEPRSKARYWLNPGDIGMYLQLIPSEGGADYDDNLYLFGETKVLINAEWAEGKIVPYEV